MEKKKTINDKIELSENGELKFHPSIVNFLAMEMCQHLKLTNVVELHDRLKRISAVRIKTPTTYYPEVFKAPISVVKWWTRCNLGLVSVPGLYSDLDLEKGKYEGGFKVWECTKDLVKYLVEDLELMPAILNRQTEFFALELGAGASLPTIALISRMLQVSQFRARYAFHIQDYNWEVLASLALIDFTANLPSNYVEALLETRCLKFFYGDWKDFRSERKYDLIMASEIIYNLENYSALHDILAGYTAEEGYVIIATKNVYFGLSGSLYAWLDYIISKAVFVVLKNISVKIKNIPRSILILKKLANNT